LDRHWRELDIFRLLDFRFRRVYLEPPESPPRRCHFAETVPGRPEQAMNCTINKGLSMN